MVELGSFYFFTLYTERKISMYWRKINVEILGNSCQYQCCKVCSCMREKKCEKTLWI